MTNNDRIGIIQAISGIKVGDKVKDTSTKLIGEVSRIRVELDDEFPIEVNFAVGNCTYDIRGFYNRRVNERHIKLINPKHEVEAPAIVEITQTFIQIKEGDILVLLPLASTSFKIKHDIIVATNNNIEYTIPTSDISQTINQLLNPTKKELL